MTGEQEEFERDAWIVSRSITLTDVARELLHEDAGIGLIRAALVAWERQFSRAVALELGRTSLMGIMSELQHGTGRSN